MHQFAAGQQGIGGRSHQEDAFRFFELGRGFESFLVAILADGMGGHAAGDVASNTAADAFARSISDTADPPYSRLVSGLDDANRAIRARVEAEPACAGMGTTLVAVVLSADGLRWISVGDSLLLHVSRGGITRLNADHSMAPRLDAAARRGEITVEEAVNSPSRSALLSAISGEEITRVDLSMEPFQIEDGDRIIVASDGIDTLTLEELASISEVVAGQSIDKFANMLVREVEERRKPNQDNVTVIVIDGGFVRKARSDRSPATQNNEDTDQVATRPLRR